MAWERDRRRAEDCQRGRSPYPRLQVTGRVLDAAGHVAKMAAVLNEVKRADLDEAELRFGIRAGGRPGWGVVAKAAAEGGFAVTRCRRLGAGAHVCLVSLLAAVKAEMAASSCWGVSIWGRWPVAVRSWYWAPGMASA